MPSMSMLKKLAKTIIARSQDSFLTMADSVSTLRGTSPSAARVVFNMRPVHLPWGGGNQWVNQMVRSLRSVGYSVRFSLGRATDCVVLVDPRLTEPNGIGMDDIDKHKKRYPRAVCVHRVNENDQRKQTTFMDRLLAEANSFADYTVFISSWLRDYHAERWFDKRKPHSVITNGADPRIYNPFGSTEHRPGDTFRIVTHHWSDNWLKGFAVYQEVDRLIAKGKLPDTELWVIGRWPSEISWKAAKTFSPTRGVHLARLLRNCHVYITASKWEPGGMHFIEGAQCGLPVLYQRDGGGIVEVARRFGIGFADDVYSAIVEMRERYPELRRKVLENAPSGDEMCCAYRQVIQHAILSKPRSMSQP
jgi:glycosyltransferase involved in cell wall biosynthesis